MKSDTYSVSKNEAYELISVCVEKKKIFFFCFERNLCIYIPFH